ncbi:unnamed protein product [Amoebophrya sp. A120]|nr:unnamed protein product [Amoebophrya sp. A120]|eukprot:GSA120T00009276001.1
MPLLNIYNLVASVAYMTMFYSRLCAATVPFDLFLSTKQSHDSPVDRGTTTKPHATATPVEQQEKKNAPIKPLPMKHGLHESPTISTSFLKAPALLGIEASIKALHPSEPGSMIKAVLADALQSAAMAEGVSLSAAQCGRNYAGCPQGWGAIGTECLSPVGYAGPCAKRVDFSGLTALERAVLADECGAVFPCF